MQFSLFAFIALAIAVPVQSSVVARVEGEITDAAPAKWLSYEDEISYTNDSSIALAPRVGTEVVTCYNTGTKADRAPIVSVIDDWCGRVIGTTVTNGKTISARYDYGTFTVLVSAAAINGFVIDGNCNRLLRLPVDKCNTGGVNGKQGGYETDLCGQWRTDPGSNGSDF
ncbi:hypothetical protein C8R46DRAFT_1262988 [Mycena filopes]|nr:hypothetical protein C8R46DRAFT_1262988 [Mycena filopes]